MKNVNNQTTGAMSLMLAAAVLAGATSPARAQDATIPPPTITPETTPMTAPDADSDEAPWQFGVTIPLWAPQIVGNVTVAGRTEDVNISFNTLRQHLDASFSLALNAQKGKFGVYGDIGYMKFSASGSGPEGGFASGDLKFVIADAGVSYVLVKTGEKYPFVLAGTAGLRYWYAATSATFTDAFGNVLFSGGKTYDLVQPVIGLRASEYFTPKFHLDLAGDIGGFDVNHSTDWTWSAGGMLTYDFAKWFSLSAGYKALALRELEGGGGSQNGFSLIFNGVAIAATFKF